MTVSRNLARFARSLPVRKSFQECIKTVLSKWDNNNMNLLEIS